MVSGRFISSLRTVASDCSGSTFGSRVTFREPMPSAWDTSYKPSRYLS